VRQLQFFTSAQMAQMRDRTASRNYSPERDAFRRVHERHRAWGLDRRYAAKRQRLQAALRAPATGDAVGSGTESPARQAITGGPGAAVVSEEQRAAVMAPPRVSAELDSQQPTAPPHISPEADSRQPTATTAPLQVSPEADSRQSSATTAPPQVSPEADSRQPSSITAMPDVSSELDCCARARASRARHVKESDACLTREGASRPTSESQPRATPASRPRATGAGQPRLSSRNRSRFDPKSERNSESKTQPPLTREIQPPPARQIELSPKHESEPPPLRQSEPPRTDSGEPPPVQQTTPPLTDKAQPPPALQTEPTLAHVGQLPPVQRIEPLPARESQPAFANQTRLPPDQEVQRLLAHKTLPPLGCMAQQLQSGDIRQLRAQESRPLAPHKSRPGVRHAFPPEVTPGRKKRSAPRSLGRKDAVVPRIVSCGRRVTQSEQGPRSQGECGRSSAAEATLGKGGRRAARVSLARTLQKSSLGVLNSVLHRERDERHPPFRGAADYLVSPPASRVVGRRRTGKVASLLRDGYALALLAGSVIVACGAAGAAVLRQRFLRAATDALTRLRRAVEPEASFPEDSC